MSGTSIIAKFSVSLKMLSETKRNVQNHFRRDEDFLLETIRP